MYVLLKILFKFEEKVVELYDVSDDILFSPDDNDVSLFFFQAVEKLQWTSHDSACVALL